MAASREEGCYEKSILKHFHVYKGLSNDDVGVARGTVFSGDTAGSWSQNRRFRSTIVGGGLPQDDSRVPSCYT